MGATRKKNKRREGQTGSEFGTAVCVFCHLERAEVGRKWKIVKVQTFNSLIHSSILGSFRTPSSTQRLASFFIFLANSSSTGCPQHHFHTNKNELARTEAVDDRTQAEEIVGAQSTAERRPRSTADKGERGQRKVRSGRNSHIHADRSFANTTAFTSLIRYCKTTTDHLVSLQGYFTRAGLPCGKPGTGSHIAFVIC